MGERRKTARVPVSEPVIIVWERGNVVGEVRDVSREGMYVALANAGDVTGSSLVVQILPSHPRHGVELSGVVRWSDARGIGIELQEADSRGLAAIDGLIASRQAS